MARPLIVRHGNFLVDAVLNQRIHDRTISLSEKLASMMGLFGYYDETVVVQYVTVEFIGGTCLFASSHSGTLEKYTQLKRIDRYKGGGEMLVFTRKCCILCK